jgi:hypothetical protein
MDFGNWCSCNFFFFFTYFEGGWAGFSLFFNLNLFLLCNIVGGKVLALQCVILAVCGYQNARNINILSQKQLFLQTPFLQKLEYTIAHLDFLSVILSTVLSSHQ